MQGALLLVDENRFVESYTCSPMFKIYLTTGRATIFAEATGLKELIEKTTEHKNVMLIMASKKSQKVRRQISTHMRLVAALKRECERPEFDTNKIDTLKDQIARIEKNIR